MRGVWVVSSLALLFGLSACTEKPQVSEAQARGVPAYMGTGAGPYTADGWKVGDEASWSERMRSRAQAGQNEYLRASGG